MTHSSLRPHDPLIGLDAAHAFVYELLNALALVGLRRIDVALRVRRDAVHREELARLAAAVTELRKNLQRLPVHHVRALFLAVRQEDVLLLRILRERDVPHRAVSPGLWLDDLLLHELAILPEDLNAIVRAIAHIHQSIIRRLGAMEDPKS